MTLLVVCYSKVSMSTARKTQNKICIEYVRDVPELCGRVFTQKLMECLMSPTMIEKLKREDRKAYLHILEVCDKKKCELNASGGPFAIFSR